MILVSSEHNPVAQKKGKIRHTSKNVVVSNANHVNIDVQFLSLAGHSVVSWYSRQVKVNTDTDSEMAASITSAK